MAMQVGAARPAAQNNVVYHTEEAVIGVVKQLLETDCGKNNVDLTIHLFYQERKIDTITVQWGGGSREPVNKVSCDIHVGEELCTERNMGKNIEAVRGVVSQRGTLFAKWTYKSAENESSNMIVESVPFAVALTVQKHFEWAKAQNSGYWARFTHFLGW